MRYITFASGSGGNCSLLSMDGTHLLLDAGISCRRIRENLSLCALTEANLSGILITHEHSDHIAGLATLVKRSDVPIFAPRCVAAHLRRTITGVERVLRVVEAETEFALGSLRLRPFATPHDTPQSVGWRICGSSTFALATDMGCVTDAIRAGLTGADVVLIEANHDVDMLRNGPYPFPLKRRILSDHGHLSNENCALLAAELAAGGTKHIILGHLSRENNTPACAFQTVKAALEGSGAALYVAPADERFTLEYEKEPSCLL